MNVHHCDNCKRKIAKDSGSIGIGLGTVICTKELCAKCAEPIRKILARYKLTS